MPQLTEQQKKDLKIWERNLRIWFVVAMGWIFVVVWPLLLLEKLFGNIIWYIHGAITLLLMVGGLRHAYSARCPACKTRLYSYLTGGYIISLPKKCRKCGASFHQRKLYRG